MLLYPHYFSDFPDPEAEGMKASYNILVSKLYKRRFYNVTKDAIDQFCYEAEQEDDTTVVPYSLPGIAIIREVFTAVNQIDLVHPVVAESEPEKAADPYEQQNFAVSFQPIAQCGLMYCKFCYSESQILPEKDLFTIGLPVHDHAW